MHATLICAVTFAFALPRTDCHSACNDGPAQLCFRGPVDDSISIIIHPRLPRAPWERYGWRKRGVAEPRTVGAEWSLICGVEGWVGRHERVVWLNQPVGNAIKPAHAAPLCTATHGPPLKLHPRRRINFRLEREKERGRGWWETAREQTLIITIGVASHALH